MSDGENRRRVLYLESAAAAAQDRGKAEGKRLVGDARRGANPAARADVPVRPSNPAARFPEQNRRVVGPARPNGHPNQISQVISLPKRGRKRSYPTIISFFVFVVFPVVIAAIYYTFIAANQYVAEFRFSVTDTSSTSVPSSSSLGGISSLLGSAVTSSSQNYMVTDFLTSRQAVDELQKKINVTSLYARPIADWWARFDASKPIEKFLPYWQSMVTANYDQVTGIATAEVRAFTPQDADLIAKTLVGLAENLVNDIATRPQKDAVRYAEKEVERAEQKLKDIQTQLTAYRNKESVIDPTNSVVMSNVTLSQNLHASLSQLQTQLASLLQQQVNRNAPTVQVLQSRIDATKAQIADVDAKISKDTKSNQALSKVVSEYEGLMLDRTFAQNLVTSTMSTLEMARANAAQQHLYITPYVRPSLPQSSTYPNRPKAIFMVAFVCFLSWLVGLLIYRSIREHL
jgi:capsular polysaccharide transport system permease protein